MDRCIWLYRSYADPGLPVREGGAIRTRGAKTNHVSAKSYCRGANTRMGKSDISRGGIDLSGGTVISIIQIDKENDQTDGQSRWKERRAAQGRGRGAPEVPRLGDLRRTDC